MAYETIPPSDTGEPSGPAGGSLTGTYPNPTLIEGVTTFPWTGNSAWYVDTSTGSDSAAGTVGAPLATVNEIARRLGTSRLTAAMTVQLTGNMVAGDNPVFRFRVEPGITFTLTGVPTVIYTGAVTSYAAAAASPSTGDDQLEDTSVPTSFTASGMLANGVLFQRTSGGAAEWYAAKDLGTKILRVSRPMNTGTFTEVALSAGQTYTASTLPSVNEMKFDETAALSVILDKVYSPTAFATWASTCLWFSRSWLVTPQLGAVYVFNCAISGGGTMSGLVIAGGLAGIQSGMFRHTGAGAFTFYETTANLGFTQTWQGIQLQVQHGFLDIGGGTGVFPMRSYDVTSGFPLTVSYYGRIWMVAGVTFSGSGNVNIAKVSIQSQIAHVAATPWIAGSASSGTPITVNGTGAMSVADEIAGNGAPNVQTNGIFLTS